MRESSEDKNTPPDLDDSEQQRFGTISSIFYIIVILLIGIPIWWKTTTPSRHSLPDVSNLLVHFQMVTNEVPVSIVSVSGMERDSLRQQLIGNWPHKASSDGSLSYKYSWKVRQVVKSEQRVLDQFKTLKEIDEALGKLDGHQTRGKIFLYLIPKQSGIKADGHSVAFGSYRSAYIFVDEDNESQDESSLGEQILETVDTILDGRAAVKSELMELSSHEAKDSLTTLAQSEIDVLINIIMEDVTESDDFQETKLKELNQLAKKVFVKETGILDLIDVKITSQMVYYPFSNDFIESNLVTLSSNTGKERLFNVSNVPQLLNAIESRVVEHDNKQSYHLTIYIPSTKSSPLEFYDETSGQRSNALVTPYRGGILVWNQKEDFNVGFKTFMRSLIGLESLQMKQSLNKNIFFSKWELDSVIRKVTVLQLAKTLSSLESIQKLLDKVSNIVILEEISLRMHLAVELSHRSMDELASGKIKEAHELSSKAYRSSETAFFDPSLLALLYFPDDQKYAVYFPLFLPVSLPLLASIKHIAQSIAKNQ